MKILHQDTTKNFFFSKGHNYQEKFEYKEDGSFISKSIPGTKEKKEKKIQCISGIVSSDRKCHPPAFIEHILCDESGDVQESKLLTYKLNLGKQKEGWTPFCGHHHGGEEYP